MYIKIEKKFQPKDFKCMIMVKIFNIVGTHKFSFKNTIKLSNKSMLSHVSIKLKN